MPYKNLPTHSRLVTKTDTSWESAPDLNTIGASTNTIPEVNVENLEDLIYSVFYSEASSLKIIDETTVEVIMPHSNGEISTLILKLPASELERKIKLTTLESIIDLEHNSIVITKIINEEDKHILLRNKSKIFGIAPDFSQLANPLSSEALANNSNTLEFLKALRALTLKYTKSLILCVMKFNLFKDFIIPREAEELELFNVVGAECLKKISYDSDYMPINNWHNNTVQERIELLRNVANMDIIRAYQTESIIPHGKTISYIGYFTLNNLNRALKEPEVLENIEKDLTKINKSHSNISYLVQDFIDYLAGKEISIR